MILAGRGIFHRGLFDVIGHAPGHGRGNHFSYGGFDPVGMACPLGAHVRRANPRDSFAPHSAAQIAITNRHRILRLGRRYAGANGEVGLMFMCVNADIGRQFEFVQQTWILAPSFHGLQNEVDAMIGQRSVSRDMTIPTPSGPLCLKGLQDFVTVRGSGYFFLPGRTAIRFLTRVSDAETNREGATTL